MNMFVKVKTHFLCFKHAEKEKGRSGFLACLQSPGTALKSLKCQYRSKEYIIQNVIYARYHVITI